MKIDSFVLHPDEVLLKNGKTRSVCYLSLIDEMGNQGRGEIAPLLGWSLETLDESLKSFNQKQEAILNEEWCMHTLFEKIEALGLYPSATFGLESALLSILNPVQDFSIPVSALLMGSREEILKQAELRYSEGFTSAKLKVSHLSFQEAKDVIDRLKDVFFLRIDVNRSWETNDSLQFFEQYSLNTFDYVEEPFKNPCDLALFPHALAVDESFPEPLHLKDLESLPTLKALIYKPTIQGGLTGCLPLYKWVTQKGIQLVLSGCFESDLGLMHVASLAHRLSLSAPVGIGTYHHLNRSSHSQPFHFSHSFAHIAAQPASFFPK